METMSIVDFEVELSKYFIYKKYTDYMAFLKDNGLHFDENTYIPPLGKRVENLTEGLVFDAFFCGIYTIISSKDPSIPVNVANPNGDSWFHRWKYNYIVIGAQDKTHITQWEVSGLPFSTTIKDFFHRILSINENNGI